jgi:membrane-anchored protein YejM (alkaline phosphatase superfamily)
MNTLTKCQIIEEFAKKCMDEKIHADFITYNDLGVPLAISVNSEMADLKNNGQEIIDETYSLMCELLEVDANKDYANLDDLWSECVYRDEDTED